MLSTVKRDFKKKNYSSSQNKNQRSSDHTQQGLAAKGKPHFRAVNLKTHRMAGTWHAPLTPALSRADAQQPGPLNADRDQEHKKTSVIIKAVRGWGT